MVTRRGSSNSICAQSDKQHPAAGAPCQPRKRGRGRALGGNQGGGPHALESFFDPRAGDNITPLTEAHPGAQGAVLVPKVGRAPRRGAWMSADGFRVVLGGEAAGTSQRARRLRRSISWCISWERSHDL